MSDSIATYREFVDGSRQPIFEEPSGRHYIVIPVIVDMTDKERF
jgi:hypothetical protein